MTVAEGVKAQRRGSPSASVVQPTVCGRASLPNQQHRREKPASELYPILLLLLRPVQRLVSLSNTSAPLRHDYQCIESSQTPHRQSRVSSVPRLTPRKELILQSPICFPAHCFDNHFDWHLTGWGTLQSNVIRADCLDYDRRR